MTQSTTWQQSHWFTITDPRTKQSVPVELLDDPPQRLSRPMPVEGLGHAVFKEASVAFRKSPTIFDGQLFNGLTILLAVQFRGNDDVYALIYFTDARDSAANQLLSNFWDQGIARPQPNVLRALSGKDKVPGFVFQGKVSQVNALPLNPSPQEVLGVLFAAG